MSLFMDVFFNLQHTHPGVDKSSQVPGDVPHPQVAVHHRISLLLGKLGVDIYTKRHI